MHNEYILDVPSAFMHLDPCEKSEVTDEILYGTCITKLENKNHGLIFCKTSYGYCGYLDASLLVQKSKSAKNRLVVTSRFCSLLEYPLHKYAPIAVVPSGSIIHALKICQNGDFLGIKTENKEFFLHKSHVTSENSLHNLSDENSKRSQIVKTALSYLRTPYLWAGKTHLGIDCSGLCFMAYTRCGIGVYRDAEFDGRYMRKIHRRELKKADLIYYNGHVIMYIGADYYIHSSSSAGKVTINSFCKSNSLYLPKFDSTEICCASSLAFSGNQ